MVCNDRSPIKLDEINLYNRSFWEYPCYDELEHLLDNCGSDLFEPLFEVYRTRIMSGTEKPPGYTRLITMPNPYGTSSDKKVLHY